MDLMIYDLDIYSIYFNAINKDRNEKKIFIKSLMRLKNVVQKIMLIG